VDVLTQLNEHSVQRDTSAFLCYSCIERAKKLVEFQQQLTGQKKEMATILGCGVRDTDGGLSKWIIIAMIVLPCTLLHNRPHRASQRIKTPKTATEPAKISKASVRYTTL